MNKQQELRELEQEAEVLDESLKWWEKESAQVMKEVWSLKEDEEDLKRLQILESKLEYLENKGYFEAKRMKELDGKLLKYFTKRMKECQEKKKGTGEE